MKVLGSPCSMNTDKASWQANERRRVEDSSDLKKTKMAILVLVLVLKYRYALGLNRSFES